MEHLSYKPWLRHLVLRFLHQFTFFFARIYILVIMELESRRIVYFGVTLLPTLDWLKQQIRQGTWDESPKFMIHDNDGIFGQLGKPVSVRLNGKSVSCRSSLDYWLVTTMGIRGIPTPFEAPNANAHCERLVQTLRQECLNHMLFLNEQHLIRVLLEYQDFYNRVSQYFTSLCGWNYKTQLFSHRSRRVLGSSIEQVLGAVEFRFFENPRAIGQRMQCLNEPPIECAA